MTDYGEYETRVMASMDKAMMKIIERLNQLPGVKITWMHDEIIIESPESTHQQVLEILSEMRNEAIKDLSTSSALPTRADVDKDPKREFRWPTSKKPDGLQ